MSDYKKKLQDKFEWYMDTISSIHTDHRWQAIPSDSFYYKLATGKVATKKDEVDWLEYANEKLQVVLAMIEKHLEREKFKQYKGVDLMEKLKRI